MILLTDTIYIAGKITGLADYEAKFQAAVCMLREHGFTKIINPACLPPNLAHEQYMTICFAMIDAADAVYFLDNWHDSEGARREFLYARSRKKKCLGKGIDSFKEVETDD